MSQFVRLNKSERRCMNKFDGDISIMNPSSTNGWCECDNCREKKEAVAQPTVSKVLLIAQCLTYMGDVPEYTLPTLLAIIAGDTFKTRVALADAQWAMGYYIGTCDEIDKLTLLCDVMKHILLLKKNT